MSVLAYRKAKLRWRRFWQKIEGSLKRKLIAATAGILHAVIFVSVFGPRLEMFAFDSWFFIRGNIPPSEKVIIVAIDHRSEEALGISPLAPWPRRFHAKLLESLREKGVRRVIFDIFFRSVGTIEGEDQMLAEALHASDCTIGSFHDTEVLTTKDGTRVPVIKEKKPLPIFQRSAPRVVSMNVWMRDSDQVIRHISAAGGEPRTRVPMTYALQGILPEKQEVPGTDDLINYYGSVAQIPTISFADALKPEFSNILKDKIVLVGKHLPTSFLRDDEKDTFRVPVPGYTMDGVEIHATIVSNLLDRSWIRRSAPEIEIAVLACFTSFLSYALMSLRVAPAGILLLSSQLLWLFGSYFAFRSGHFVPGVTMMFIILPLIFCGSVFLTARSLYRSFKEIEKAMGVKIETP